jgi:hypothetical protein
MAMIAIIAACCRPACKPQMISAARRRRPRAWPPGCLAERVCSRGIAPSPGRADFVSEAERARHPLQCMPLACGGAAAVDCLSLPVLVEGRWWHSLGPLSSLCTASHESPLPVRSSTLELTPTAHRSFPAAPQATQTIGVTAELTAPVLPSRLWVFHVPHRRQADTQPPSPTTA